MTSVECIRRRKIFNHVSARLISCTIEEIEILVIQEGERVWFGVFLFPGPEIWRECFCVSLRAWSYVRNVSQHIWGHISTVILCHEAARAPCLLWLSQEAQQAGVLCLVAVSSSTSLLHSRLRSPIRPDLEFIWTRKSATLRSERSCWRNFCTCSFHKHFFFFYSSCRIWCTVCLERLRPHLNRSY